MKEDLTRSTQPPPDATVNKAASGTAVIFVILPLLLLAIGTSVLLPRAYQITVVRSVFLVAVCLFPALLYYLFIAARKISLLNDYFVNLGRLGLLQEQDRPGLDGFSAKIERKVRLRNYVQKFEALYGPVPPTLREAIVDADDPLTILAAPAIQVGRQTTMGFRFFRQSACFYCRDGDSHCACYRSHRYWLADGPTADRL